jgi:hypothetical protein
MLLCRLIEVKIRLSGALLLLCSVTSKAQSCLIMLLYFGSRCRNPGIHESYRLRTDASQAVQTRTPSTPHPVEQYLLSMEYVSNLILSVR